MLISQFVDNIYTFTDFGDEYVVSLVDHWQKILEANGVDPANIQPEWDLLKIVINPLRNAIFQFIVVPADDLAPVYSLFWASALDVYLLNMFSDIMGILNHLLQI